MDYLKRLIALLVCSTQITTFAEDSSITTDHFSTEEWHLLYRHQRNIL